MREMDVHGAPITSIAAVRVARGPAHARDPFDRPPIGQATEQDASRHAKRRALLAPGSAVRLAD